MKVVSLLVSVIAIYYLARLSLLALTDTQL